MLVALCFAGCGLWLMHAQAWDLGRRSPVLNYDTAQYALAARELATHGRLATTFALPIELATHVEPPWPLAVVQPGLVVLEAAIFRLAPPHLRVGGRSLAEWSRPDEREWLILPIAFTSYILIGAVLGLATLKMLQIHAPQLSDARCAACGGVVGLAFLLDPEAQHFAVGGFTELPFTLGLVGATAMLSMGRAAVRPFAFGLILGITGAFRANMMWLAPVFAIAAAATAPRENRVRVLLLVMAGFALPLAPWWFYKWRTFGNPGWDLTRFVVWDGVEHRTWFSLYHLPTIPQLPSGVAGYQLLAAKVLRNLPAMLAAVATGPRALWLGALVVWCAIARPARPLRAAGLATLAMVALSVAAAALSIPWLRYVFPARIVLEAAGLLATLALASRLAAMGAGPLAVRVVRLAVATLALGWGLWQTVGGLSEARATSLERGVPDTLTLMRLGTMMKREIPVTEPVMSNLGPVLAWHARRPVIHLALTPEDVESCRQRAPFRHVLLAFRDASKAWPGWEGVMAHPVESKARPELNIERIRVFQSEDGFRIAWLELGPPVPRLARGATRVASSRPQ